MVVVTSSENDTNKSNNNASIPNITAVDVVDLTIAKEANVEDIAYVGQNIVFTVTVKNIGQCDATNVNVSEVLSPHIKMVGYSTWVGDYDVDEGVWYIGDLARGDWAQLIIVTEVVSAGNISNVVVVTSSENDTNKSNNNASIPNITALDNVDLVINKTVDVKTDVVAIGDSITFTVTVRNNGPCDATNVNVTEVLSPHLKLVDYHTWDSYYDVDEGIWYIGNLTNGDWRQLIIETEVVSAGNISNVVVVTSSENDTNKSNNNASIPNITAVDVVDLTIAKEANVGDEVLVGQNIVFRVTVRNIGQCDATNVNVSEVLSPHIKMVGYSTWVGDYDVDEGVWYIGDLARGDWAQLIIVTEVVSAGNISNVVVVTSNENDTNKSNNNASIPNITAKPAVDLYITKTVKDNLRAVNVSDIIEFDIVVYNAGPCDATNVNVTEVLSPHLKLINNITENGYYDVNDGVWYIGNLTNQSRAYLSIIAQVISPGIISNVVVVNSTENDTDYSTNKAEIDNITAGIIVDLSINKTVSTTSAKVGDEITYVITVHNYGPHNATNVNVTEKLSNYVSLIKSTPSRGEYDETAGIWTIGDVKNNETLTLTLIVKILAAETIENFVSVNSTENDTDPSNNNYTSENVTVEKWDTPIILIPQNITYGDDEIIIVILPENATGTVNITVNGKQYNDVPIDGGIAELIIPDLAGGDYNVTVVYGGDTYYVPNSTDGKFNVAPAVPIIRIEVVDIWHGEIEVLNVTVDVPGTVNITVFGITISYVPLNHSVTSTDVLKAAVKEAYDGKATWNLINLPVGRYPAFAIYNGNENYTSVNTSDVFYVRDKPSTVVVTADDIYVGEDALVNVQVGPYGVTGNVTLIVEGVEYDLNITEDGKANVTISGLPAGLKHAYVKYNGDILYRPSENTTTFNVLKFTPPIVIDAPDITVGENGTITVTVPANATGTITIEIEGKTYTQPVENGTAVFTVPDLKAGEHEIKAYYSGDDYYYPANTTGTIKVNPLNETNNKTIEIKEVQHDGIDLSQYETGNPIFILLIVLLAISSRQLRRFRK